VGTVRSSIQYALQRKACPVRELMAASRRARHVKAEHEQQWVTSGSGIADLEGEKRPKGGIPYQGH